MAHRYRRRNPRLLGAGENWESLLLEGVGVGATAVVNDKLMGFARGMVPGSSGVTAKLVDAGTTLVSSMLLRFGVGFINKGWARSLGRGGDVLAVAKVGSAFVPSFSLSGSIPTPSGIFRMFQPPAAPAPALPAASSSTTSGLPRTNGTGL